MSLSPVEHATVTAILSGFAEARRAFGEVGNFTLSVRDLKHHVRRGVEGNGAALDSPASVGRVREYLRENGYIVPVERTIRGVVTLWTAA